MNTTNPLPTVLLLMLLGMVPAGAQEAILVREDGLVTEASRSNIFALHKPCRDRCVSVYDGSMRIRSPSKTSWKSATKRSDPAVANHCTLCSSARAAKSSSSVTRL